MILTKYIQALNYQQTIINPDSIIDTVITAQLDMKDNRSETDRVLEPRERNLLEIRVHK